MLIKAPRRGIEPRLADSKFAVLVHHTRKAQAEAARSEDRGASFSGSVLVARTSLLFFQLCVPVHVAHELRPAFQSHVVVGVYRLPRRSDRLATQRHAGVARRTVGLSLVARYAGQHAVRPTRNATSRSRHNVVDREFFRARRVAAVLAHVVVTLKNVASAERRCRIAQLDFSIQNSTILERFPRRPN